MSSTGIGLEFHIPLETQAPMTSTTSQVYLARFALKPTDEGHDGGPTGNEISKLRLVPPFARKQL
jgi:hypothetical protein